LVAREQHARGLDERGRRFLLILFLTASVLTVALIAPFLGAFFAAAVLACTFDSLQRRLTRRLRGRPYIAAAVISVTTVFIVFVPIAITASLTIREGRKMVSSVRQQLSERGPDGLVAPLPDMLEEPAKRLLESLRLETSIEGSPQLPQGPDDGPSRPPDAALDDGQPLKGLSTVTGAARGVLGGFAALLVDTGICVLALFFFLAEGQRLVSYLVRLSPIGERRSRDLLFQFRRVAVSVLVSSIATSVVQTLAATIGYLIASVPALPLTILATFLFSFIPSIGGSTVTVAMGALVWMSGRSGMGIFLVVWGIVVVSTIDNIVKPWFAKGGVNFPASVVFFAMVCGLAAFGPLGLVAGPLIVAFFHVAANMMRETRRHGAPPMSSPHAGS
jgi:predicted PurR-regulated permease PerM